MTCEKESFESDKGVGWTRCARQGNGRDQILQRNDYRMLFVENACHPGGQLATSNCSGSNEHTLLLLPLPLHLSRSKGLTRCCIGPFRLNMRAYMTFISGLEVVGAVLLLLGDLHLILELTYTTKKVWSILLPFHKFFRVFLPIDNLEQQGHCPKLSEWVVGNNWSLIGHLPATYWLRSVMTKRRKPTVSGGSWQKMTL